MTQPTTGSGEKSIWWGYNNQNEEFFKPQKAFGECSRGFSSRGVELFEFVGARGPAPAGGPRGPEWSRGPLRRPRGPPTPHRVRPGPWGGSMDVHGALLIKLMPRDRRRHKTENK